MKRLLLALILLAPSTYAVQAPEGCQKHFLGGEMPVVSPIAIKSHQLCFQEFALLHSGQTKTPIWVVEHLTADRIAQAKGTPRKNPFHAETKLPASERAELVDYLHSGFARGHMAPFGDMSTPTSQRESFSLANMIPQNNQNNSVYWSGIEKKVRDLTIHGDDIYVVTGPIYLKSSKTIGKGVVVPQKIFKAVYDAGENVASAYMVTNETKTQCEIMPLAKLNELYGIDAFPNISKDIKEKAVDLPAPSNLTCKLTGEVK